MTDACALSLGAGIVPGWLATTAGLMALLAISWHVLSLPRAPMPASRRRIRLSNGLLMAFAVPVTVYAAARTSPEDPRPFTIAWTMVAALMGLIVRLACLDVANTVRLHAAQRRGLRRDLSAARHDLAKLARGASVAGSSGGQSSPP